jgi:hypothetical protein
MQISVEPELMPIEHLILSALATWDHDSYYDEPLKARTPHIPELIYKPWFAVLRRNIGVLGISNLEAADRLRVLDLERYWGRCPKRLLSINKAGLIFSNACRLDMISKADYLHIERDLALFVVQLYGWLPTCAKLRVIRRVGRKDYYGVIEKNTRSLGFEGLARRIALVLSLLMAWREVALSIRQHDICDRTIQQRYYVGHNIATYFNEFGGTGITLGELQSIYDTYDGQEEALSPIREQSQIDSILAKSSYTRFLVQLLFPEDELLQTHLRKTSHLRLVK